mmetsp:Transcript_3322/g.5537  ORF Transcript_3322/g.5537 Transcript_3322/m.5537 type:complete len:411 (+) Transcript_3322:203-1435(+)
MQFFAVLFALQCVFGVLHLLTSAFLLFAHLVVLPARQTQGNAAAATHTLLVTILAHLEVVQAAQVEVQVSSVEHLLVALQVKFLDALCFGDTTSQRATLLFAQRLLVLLHGLPVLLSLGNFFLQGFLLGVLLTLAADAVVGLHSEAVLKALTTSLHEIPAVLVHSRAVLLLDSALLVLDDLRQGVLAGLKGAILAGFLQAVGQGLTTRMLLLGLVVLHILVGLLLELALDGLCRGFHSRIFLILAPLLQSAGQGHAISLDQVTLVLLHVLVIQTASAQQVLGGVKFILLLGLLNLFLVAPVVQASSHGHSALLFGGELGFVVVFPVQLSGGQQCRLLLGSLLGHLRLCFALLLSSQSSVGHALATVLLLAGTGLAHLQVVGAAVGQFLHQLLLFLYLHLSLLLQCGVAQL